MRRSRPWLQQTLQAVQERLQSRAASDGLDPAIRRDLQMALDELGVLWEEINLQDRLISRDRRRYARFFEHVPDPCVITTPVGKISEANRAALELLGTTPEKITGLPLAGFLEQEERRAFLERIAALGRSRSKTEAQDWNVRLRTASSGSLSVEMRMRAVKHASGEVAELCWLIHPASAPPKAS